MFDVIQWMTELADSQFSYNALNELLKDREALKHHLSSNYKLIEANTDSDEVTTREIFLDDFTDEDNYLNSYIDNIARAIDIYRRQVIVLAVTYTEGIILDFMESLFIAFPIRMYDYLDSGSEQNLKGKVDLKDILSTNTKDDLVTMLSRRAASIATRGKFGTIISNLEKTSKAKLDTALTGKLGLLVELRNRIVHEASTEDIADQAVKDAFETVNNLLQSLSRIAAEKKIPYSDFS